MSVSDILSLLAILFSVGGVIFEVYNSNRTLISSSKGTANITNNGSESMYYIVLSGAKTMDYKFVEL